MLKDIKLPVEIIPYSKGAGQIITMNGIPFNSVSDKYKLIRHEEIDEKVRAFFKVHGITPQNEMVTFFGKQNTSVKVRYNLDIVNVDGDKYIEAICFYNSYDSMTRLNFRYELMRQVCSNGMCVAEKSSIIVVKHMGHLDVAKSIITLLDQSKITLEFVTKLQSKLKKSKQIKDLSILNVGETLDFEKMNYIGRYIMEFGNNAWGQFQAYSDYISNKIKDGNKQINYSHKLYKVFKTYARSNS